VSAAKPANLDSFGPKSKVEEGAVVKLDERLFIIAVSTGKFLYDGKKRSWASPPPGPDLR